MIANRLEAIRAIVLACLIALVFALSACASRPASVTPANGAVPPATASTGASPSAGARAATTLAATATPDLGTVTPSPEVVADAPSATEVVAGATTDQVVPATVVGAGASPIASPAADVTRGAESATSAVPLFLTVTAPAQDLLEVPTGTAGVTISGKTVPSAVLSVNGNLVIPDSSGNFQVSVPVNDDVTLVEVVASDVTGAEFHVQRVIVRD